jgi:hypothetical protein
MTSYLKDRNQIVTVNGKHGTTFFINIGVGQGTVLGPTLFKIYIMDLHLHTSLFCMKFADDSSFKGSAKTRDELQDYVNLELVKVFNWFKNNRLTLHPDKSKFLIHSRDKLISIKLDSKNISRCGYGLQEESVKLLGLNIDENLDWKVHLKNLETKISKGNYLLWRHGKKLNVTTKKVIYESFVRCHLLYGLTVWGGAKPSLIKPLEKLLHKIWKKIGNRNSHTLPRLKKNSILKLEDELAIQESKVVWRWENKKIPKSLSDIVIEKQDNLRGRRFMVNRNYKQNSINLRLTKRANNCISDISTYRSKKTLAKSLKKSYLTKNITSTVELGTVIFVHK